VTLARRQWPGSWAGPGLARLPALAGALLLAACGSGENDPGPGGVTVGEAKALDEAAEMLEQQRLDPAELAPPDETRQAAPEPAPSD
jgi:hypothetical protein